MIKAHVWYYLKEFWNLVWKETVNMGSTKSYLVEFNFKTRFYKLQINITRLNDNIFWIISGLIITSV